MLIAPTLRRPVSGTGSSTSGRWALRFHTTTQPCSTGSIQPARSPPLTGGGRGPATRTCHAVHERTAQPEPSTTTVQQPDRAPAVLSTSTMLLLLVTLLWGTYSPSIRFLYTLDSPPSPALLTAIRTVVSATALLSLSQLLPAPPPPSSTPPTTPPPASSPPGKPPTLTPVDPATSAPANPINPQLIWAGLQLGIYNFLGTALQVAGLQATTAAKAAFLGQLTAVITPALASAAGESIPATTWLACCLGMAGGLLLSLDGTSPDTLLTEATVGLSASGDLWGPALILAGCVFYGLATVRLSEFAPWHRPVHLATVKTVWLALLSVGWYAADAMGHANAAGIEAPPGDSAFLLNASLVAWMVLVFSGVGPGALASLLQTTAQAKVSATRAQVIFACTPVWSALLGVLLLHEDRMGPAAWAGAAVILVATLLPALPPRRA